MTCGDAALMQRVLESTEVKGSCGQNTEFDYMNKSTNTTDQI